MSVQSSLSLKELAGLIHAEVVGDETYQIEGLATLASASSKHLSFCTNDIYKKLLDTSDAGCVLLHVKDQYLYSGNKLLSDDPYLAFAILSEIFAPVKKVNATEIHPSAIIADDVQVGEAVSIGANVVIESGCHIAAGAQIYPGCYVGENVDIGTNTIVYANVTLYHKVTIGDNCILHSGSVIGSDGFGFAHTSKGWKKIHQLGGVTIGDGVEIGAGTTIDRGALDDTEIASGVKIDNQVQIAHNVKIGKDTAIAGAVAIAGSTEIGQRCTIAGAVGIVGHLKLTDDVHITAMSLVTKSISKSGSYSSGVPLNDTRQWRKNAARFNQLDQLARQLKSIKK